MFLLLFNFSCKEDLTVQTDRLNSTKKDNPHAYYLEMKTGVREISLRTSTRYSLGDALEYLNDGMNFLYCRPGEHYQNTLVYTDTFALAVDGFQTIAEEDLIDLMDTIAYKAGSYYYTSWTSYKEPFMFVMKNVAGAPSGFAKIETIFMMTEGGETSTEDEYVYEDSWLYGQWGSDASSYCSAEGANADAADLFRRDLRKHVVHRDKFEPSYFKDPFVVCYGGHSDDCFSEEIAIGYLPADLVIQGNDLINDNDVTPWDNLYDYLLFVNYSGNPNFHECLSPGEMNFHFECMKALALDALPDPVGDTVIAQIEVGYNALFSINTTIFHSMLVVLAQKIIIYDEEHYDPIILPCCP